MLGRPFTHLCLSGNLAINNSKSWCSDRNEASISSFQESLTVCSAEPLMLVCVCLITSTYFFGKNQRGFCRDMTLLFEILHMTTNEVIIQAPKVLPAFSRKRLFTLSFCVLSQGFFSAAISTPESRRKSKSLKVPTAHVNDGISSCETSRCLNLSTWRSDVDKPSKSLRSSETDLIIALPACRACLVNIPMNIFILN